MKTNKPVEIHQYHQNERKSKRNFEELLDSMSMRLAFPWADNDYGIDGEVELISRLENLENYKPDSKFFLFQLKSTEKIKIKGKYISYSLPVNKIIQWHSANLPFLFVLNELETNDFYALWIDDAVVSKIEASNPVWASKNSVTIKIPVESKLGNNAATLLREYVLNWKISSKKIVKSGTYFELKDRCKANLDSFGEIITPFDFGSANNAVEHMVIQIEQAIYRIAITGPSRVGKSTLINTLLKRIGVSPTGLFQTTGVPIQFLPGKEDSIKIIFTDGKTMSRKFSEKNIEEYASQDYNAGNKKKVAVISVHLANPQLEQGVSLFDIPGLDDPDEDIYNYTLNTISKANAILYLIDASPFENGGYIFRSEYKRHILEFGQSLDKIFLVFTKTNVLTGNKLELLKERVATDLKKLELFDKVSEKIHFISAEESMQVRIKGKKAVDSVKLLEEDVWSYLLSENKIGLANLLSVNNQISRSLEDFKSILAARLLQDKERIELENALQTLMKKVPQLAKIYFDKEKENKSAISDLLENRKNGILLQMEEHLKLLPETVDLPTNKSMKHFLAAGCYKTMEDLNKKYIYQVNQQGIMIHNWIEENLKQVRGIIGGSAEKEFVDLKEIEDFEVPPIDFSSSVGVGLFTGLLAFVVTPPLAFLAGISAFLGNLAMSASERRAERISKTMERARKSYDKQFEKIDKAYMNSIDKTSKRIMEYAGRKITLFYNDLNEQTGKLGKKLSDAEEKHYKTASVKAEKLKKVLEEYAKEINSYYL